MYRFVILRHQTSSDEHWDVMLESGAVLATWSIPPQLPIGSSFACTAMQLPNHRKCYLDYEGEIAGNRGTVARIDVGTYEQLSPETYILHGVFFSGKLAVNGDKMTFVMTL